MTLKPRAVVAGSRAPHVRILAPASSARAERLRAGAGALAVLGYTVSFGEHAQGRCPPYFAATVEERLADLHEGFRDPAVDVLMCTRGGYGSNYLLESIDLDLVRSHAKPLFGYSDLTAMETWLMDRTGLVTFHGPMLAADFYREDGVDERSFAGALGGELLEYGAQQGLRSLRWGRAEGTVYGGCLTLLTSLLGTRFAPQTEGKLLFLEDVGVKPYQVDRMLRQLRMAGKLEGVCGVMFGEMSDCGAEAGSQDQRMLEDAILGALDWGVAGGFQGPVAMGLRSGHVSRANVTVPLNVQAELVVDEEPVLRLREPAVVR
ncbi:MAG TPA: LD-carboxypeptidase [Acidobacteriaceae bacterium]